MQMRQSSDNDNNRPVLLQSIVQSDLMVSEGHLPQNTINLQDDDTLLVIDKTDRSLVKLFWLSTIGALIIGLVLTGLTPPAYQTLPSSSQTCPNPVIITPESSIECSPFDLKSNPKLGLIIKNLNNSNKHLILNSRFYFESEQGMAVNEDIRIAQYEISRDEKIVSFSNQERFGLYLTDSTYEDRILGNQSQMVGLKSMLYYQWEIPAENLLIIVEFMNPTTSQSLRDIQIEAETINPDFTTFNLHIRIAFLVKSFIALIVYIIRSRSIPSNKRVLEHKLVLLLSVLLVMFNNPLVALLPSNTFLIFLFQVCYLLLPCYLLLFWMIMFWRADIENTQQQSSSHKRLIPWFLIIFLFMFQLSQYLFQGYNELYNHVGKKKELSPSIGLRYTNFFIILGIYGLVVFRVINVVNGDRMERYKRLAWLSVPVMGFSWILLVTARFGVDNKESKSIFLGLYLLNVYCYYLQFLYTKPEILPMKKENQIIMDNGDKRVSEHPFRTNSCTSNTSSDGHRAQIGPSSFSANREQKESGSDSKEVYHPDAYIVNN